MRTGEELLIDIFRHYNYFVSQSRTDPPFLVAKKGDVRIAVGYFFGDREVVVYDLKRFLAATRGWVYTGFFFITNTRFEYHARNFAKENTLIMWERGKLVEELGKMRLTKFEKQLVEGVEDMNVPSRPPAGPLPQNEPGLPPPGSGETGSSPDGDEDWKTNPREFFTPGQGSRGQVEVKEQEAPGPPEPPGPRSFTERLRGMFSQSSPGDTVPDQLMDMAGLQSTREQKQGSGSVSIDSRKKDRFIEVRLSSEDIYERFGKAAVLELVLQYVPYFRFSYECELYNDQGALEETKSSSIAVNGLTGQCEEWSGDVAAQEENSTGGLKVRARYRPKELGKRVKEAIITTNTRERSIDGEHHWITPQADSITHSYTGIYYFPFYNVSLPEKSVIIDATTGAAEE